MDAVANEELKTALVLNQESVIKDYFENGKFKVNDPILDGLTALQYACSKGYWTMLQYLVTEAKAAWDTTTEDGNTTAHLACSNPVTVVNVLWKAVERVLRDRYKDERMDSKHADEAVDVVKKKFLNKQNHKGETCLHYALFNNSGTAVEYLVLNAKMDWSLTTKDGNTIGHYACKYSFDVSLKELWGLVECMLRDRFRDEEKDEEAIDEALYAEKKKFLNKQNNKGETCLHLAVQNRVAKENNIAWLFENGVDAALFNNDGKTAWEVWRGANDVLLGISELSWFFLRNAEQTALSGEQPEWFRNTSWGPGIKWNEWNKELLELDQDDPLFKYQWFYVPFNKRSLFWALLRKLSSVQSSSEFGRLNMNLLSDEVQEALAPYELEDSRVREPLCAWESLGSSKKKDPTKENDRENDRRQKDNRDNEELLSLVMPYFYSEEVDVYSDKQIAVKKRQDQLAKISSSYYRFNGSEVKDLYPPVTLDEYCKPALAQDTLDGLNSEQVLTRAKRLRLLMVQQVWVWKIGNVVITAFPKEIYESKKIFDGSLGEISVLDDPFIGIGSLLSQLISIINRPAMAGLSEPVLNTFENAIIEVSTELKEYMNNPTGTKVVDIKVDQEISFYDKILDIREELGMIKSVMLQQENVWKNFISGVWPKYWSEGGNRERIAPDNKGDQADDRRNINRIARTQGQIEQLKERIQQLEEAAERVKDIIAIQLELKSKQASMKEAHATAIMSAAVFGFTLITIIFTPLGFAISLFGLPIEDFKKTGDDKYTSGYIGGWLTLTELVILALTLLAMWAVVRYGLKSSVRDLFGKGPKGQGVQKIRVQL